VGCLERKLRVPNPLDLVQVQAKFQRFMEQSFGSSKEARLLVFDWPDWSASFLLFAGTLKYASAEHSVLLPPPFFAIVDVLVFSQKVNEA
jgi:hypothetical protein